MKPSTLKHLRTSHRWAGLFFAPMIVLFAFSGLLQVIEVGDWDLPEWLMGVYDAMEDAHQHQRMRRGTTLQLAATVTTVVMSVALVLTTLAGVAMAFRMHPKRRWLMVGVVAAGVAVPLIVMLV